MPWQETCVVDERLKFIGKYLRQEVSMASLCREFNISRKTGYNLVHRYLLEGPLGLYDRSRAPRHHPQAVSEDIVSVIVNLRSEHSRWGSRKPGAPQLAVGKSATKICPNSNTLIIWERPVL